jgi:hypothetical protein
MKRALLATVTLATLAFATHKHADAGYLNLGGSFTVNETNAPLTGSFPAVATLFPQTTGGLAVQLV